MNVELGIVRYVRDSVQAPITVGDSAWVTPINHMSKLVSNERTSKTSIVQAYDPRSGVFITLNSIYIPK